MKGLLITFCSHRKQHRGSGTAAVDLLRASDLEIVSEITIPVAQQLIAVRG